jgi:flavin reductase (DIM6/NTAB) family NADH-FMN oxidoreductase RutF
MLISAQDIQGMEKIPRLNLINSITGIKPGNLIGTISNEGITNLAVFSSVVHLGSNPPLIGMVLRPNTEVKRHTYDNILATGEYTINHIPKGMEEQAHYTSAKFNQDQSEFDHCGFTPKFLADFKAPAVEESPLSIGLQIADSVPIELNNTILVIGKVSWIQLDESFVEGQNHLNLEVSGSVGISGLNTYYRLQRTDQFPYARVSELPSFNGTQKD